jgi:hypothetical protein
MDQYEIALANRIRLLSSLRETDISKIEDGNNNEGRIVNWTNITARIFVNIFRGIWVGVGMYLARVALLNGKIYDWTGSSFFLPKSLIDRAYSKVASISKNNNKK